MTHLHALAASLLLALLIAAPGWGQEGAAPPDAVVLLSGDDASAWVKQGTEEPIAWTQVEDGAWQVGGGSITTKELYGDCQLHVEFMCPVEPEREGQGAGNSGIYFQGSYEVQVLNSWGIEEPTYQDCGGIYEVRPPMVNACHPPGEWQTYEILFRAPRYDDQGELVEMARLSVIQNGIWVQQNVDVPAPTRAAMPRDDLTQPGPIMLQDHGNPVRYRNIWIRTLDLTEWR